MFKRNWIGFFTFFFLFEIYWLFSGRAQLREAIFAFREQEKDFRQEIDSLELELSDAKKREARYMTDVDAG